MGINLNAVMAATVSMVLNNMSDEEINAHYLGLLLNNKRPQNLLGYDKISSLYTEADGTKMHDETRDMFMRLAGQRLGF